MPVTGRKTKKLIYALSIFLILAIDQCSKALVRFNLTSGESVPLVRNVLHVTFVSNTGAAFGLFKNFTPIFIIISIVAVLFIALLILRQLKTGKFSSNPVFNYGLVLIASGALGNLIDRLRFGYVIDFIDVRIWPVFNIADSAVTIGTFLLILSSIAQERRL